MGFTLQFVLGILLTVTITTSKCDSKELTKQTTTNLTTNPINTSTTSERSNRDVNKLIKNDTEKKSKSEQPDKSKSFINPFENHNTNSTKEENVQTNDDTDQKKSESNFIRETSARAMDISIEKYLSEDFHNKNNVYTLPDSSSSIEKIYKNEDFDFLTTEHPKFEILSELTTPVIEFFDKKYKETVDTVAQNLDHQSSIHDDGSLENFSEESIEQLSLGSNKNNTKIDYIKTKNIQKNETIDKNTIHKDLIVEQTRHINIEESFNDKTSYEEPARTEKNKGISSESNSKPVTDSTAIASGKNTVVHTTQKVIFTKPPNNKNHSHILSNNIESETIKAINNLEILASSTSTTTENLKTTTTITPTVEKDALETKLQENQVLPFEKTVQTTPPTILTTPKAHSTTDKPVPITESTVNTRTIDTSSTEASTETSTSQNESTTAVNLEETSTVITTTSSSEILEHTTEQPESTTVVTTSSILEESTVTVVPTILEETTTLTTEIDFTTTELPVVFEKETNKSLGNATNYLETTDYEFKSSKGYTVETEQYTSTESFDVTSTELPETTTMVSVISDATGADNAVIKEHITTTSRSTSTAANNPEITTISNNLSPIEVQKNEIPKDYFNRSVEVPLETINVPTNNTMLAENNVETTVITTTIADDSTNEVLPTEDGLKNGDGGNKGTVAAIAISSVGAVCLVLLAGLLYVMRKRQKRFNYGPRCTPVSLDEYSIDNLSVYNSVSRRKAAARMSKRSYGNPAFDDPSAVSHPLNFPALAKFSKNNEDIKAEFDEIPQITARTSELPEGCDTKNRYANVIPLPESRVFLKPIDGYPNSDYINANYVTGPKNTKGYYIATQAPMENTVDDFWRMVWEQQCKVILMLTQHFENGLEKCVDYLPPSEVSDCHRLFGDFQVTLKKREVKEKYIISSLQLKNMVSNSWREITHFWYLGWPEKGVPTEGNSLIAFLIEARSHMKSATLDNKKDSAINNIQNGSLQNEVNPVVVHCSPGTGRTGVVIACDIAIREFEKSRLVDVPKIVYKIRRDRASAVQTKEQYQFIYKVVSLYAMKLTGEVLES